MKTIKLIYLSILCLTLFASCSDDDDTPQPVNEEEVITTLILTLTPQGGGADVVFKTQDLDGDGPLNPEVTVGDLMANTTYNGSVQILNELESPADNITTEVLAEDEDHQFFYSFSGGAVANVVYDDMDENGNPVGLSITLETNDPSSGNLTVTLRHEPTKPNNGTLSDAGGETDISAVFAFVAI